MQWTEPTSSEHEAIVKFVKHFRHSDIILCLVFGLTGCAVLAVGIYSAVDGFQYAPGFIVFAVILLIISMGCALTNTKRSKMVKMREYKVCRCRVLSRSCTRTKYHTYYKVHILNPDGKESNYKVPGITYRKAEEGATAILVDYNHEDPSNRELPIDVVIADSFE